MKKIVWLLLIFLLMGMGVGLFWTPGWIPFSKQKTTEIRGAIDIGSGATNLKVAEVDLKTHAIVRVIWKESIPVPYQKHLEQSADGSFDPEIEKRGIEVVQILKDSALSRQAERVVAVATAAFRSAKNGKAFAEKIETETGVPVRIIDQEEEGFLAFRAAVSLIPSLSPEEAVVWDIGGGSMQLTTLAPDGEYLVEKGNTASIPFKNYVIREIQQADPNEIASPNPMNEEAMEQAVEYAASLARKTDRIFQEKIAHPETRLIAVGSLFNRSIRPLIPDAELAPSELKEVLEGWVGKGDEELPGDSLTEVAVTNPLLVLGYMEGLQMEQVEILDVNNADGALTYPPYWS